VNLAHPAWLLLLALLPVLVACALVTARLRHRQWTEFIADRLRASLLKAGSPLPRWFALVSLLAAAACLSIALARPFADAGSRTEKIMGRNVFIAIDLSRSMRVTDVKPDRLSQAKIIAYELMDAMHNERIGLIGFAGNAALCAPLTIDHAAVRETINQLDESWITLGGSNLSKPVQLAVETFRETGQRNNALILLSDGEKHEKGIDDAIQAARQAAVSIITIGVGTEDGDYVPNTDFPGNRMVDRDGKPVLSRLQKDVLTTLATETNGIFTTAGSGTHIPTLVRSAINRLESFEIEGRQRNIKVEFYQWLTFPAVLFLMLSILTGTRWRKITATPAVALLLFFFTLPLPADDPDDARKALQSGDHSRALDLYQNLAKNSTSAKRRAGFHLGAALAAYHSGDLLTAQRAYTQALLSPEPSVAREAHLGYGNTLFQDGWKRIFNSLYPTDPAKTPEMSAFDEKIRSLLQEQPEEGASVSTKIEFVITSWTDAIRHYDTTLAGNPSLTEARTNRDLTLRYLKRLAELLKEEEQQTQESLPEPSPSPSPDGSGQDEKQGEEEGDNKDKKDGSGNDGDPNQKSESNDPSGDPDNREGNPDPNQPPKQEKPGDSDKPPGKSQPRADESPEDHARRQLKENSDLERGALTPGRREFLPPEKDW
jgi:Ca-activated chloride channel family protein